MKSEATAPRLREVPVRRISVISSLPFDKVVDRLSASIGHPNMDTFRPALAAATTAAEIEALVRAAVGSSDLMEFVRYDAGAVLRKMQGGQGAKSLRLVVGNPVIMAAMAKTASDAASYAPTTIVVDERADGVHLSYDLMASLIGPYQSDEALVVARNLDAKVENLLMSAAQQ